MNIGILAGYLVNWFLLGIEHDWRWMLALGSVLPLIILLTLFSPQVHESPRWLFMKGRVEEAEKVLTLFVGREEAQNAIAEMSKQGQSNSDFASWKEIMSGCRDRQVRRMLLAGITVACGQTLCGYLPMLYYSSTVLKTAMSERAAFMGTVAMGIVKLLVVLVVLLVLERVGRRLMLLASSAGCALACVWLAVAFSFEASKIVQILGFVFFMAAFSLALGPMTFVYIAEVYPTKWRAKGMATALFISRIIGAASVPGFPLVVEWVGFSMSFWLLAAVNMVVFGLIWVLVYETRGKSLEGLETPPISSRTPSA